jgi:hypothetical protein
MAADWLISHLTRAADSVLIDTRGFNDRMLSLTLPGVVLGAASDQATCFGQPMEKIGGPPALVLPA